MKQTALTIQQNPNQLARLNDVMSSAGKAANKAAARHIFAKYQDLRPANTNRRHKADLALFEDFLISAGVPVRDLFTDPRAWQGVTHGLLEAFREWQLQNAYAIDTINVRLSTVKQYAGLALRAGVLDAAEYAQIKIVTGYKHGEKVNIDAKRNAAGIDTRRTTKARLTTKSAQPQTNCKKSEPIFLNKTQRETLTANTSTPQAIRDNLIILLMVDLGLRVGEVAILDRKNFDNPHGLLVNFYRPKTNKRQTLAMTAAVQQAANAYMQYAPSEGNVWLASAMKNEGKANAGKLTKRGMSAGAINQRISLLGRNIGIENLSPHDLRHTFAERAKANPTKLLQNAGGWNSPAMALRYQQSGAISNAGLILADE